MGKGDCAYVSSEGIENIKECKINNFNDFALLYLKHSFIISEFY